MQALYPVIISFLIIFLSELGDKTQILVLSFSSKLKTATILLGVALGSFCSHGIAILFGSALGNTSSLVIHQTLKFVTYASFILIGLISLLPKKQEATNSQSSMVNKIAKLSISYVFIIAFSIAVGEIGDKTFLASIGLGIGYPFAKFSLILGAILGMCASDFIAIALGKFLSSKIPVKKVELLSSLLFLLFGIIGLMRFFADIFI